MCVGLVGKTDLDLLRAMEVCQTKEDFIRLFARHNFESDPQKKVSTVIDHSSEKQ
jgi:hypothetical protein